MAFRDRIVWLPGRGCGASMDTVLKVRFYVRPGSPPQYMVTTLRQRADGTKVERQEYKGADHAEAQRIRHKLMGLL